MHQTFMPMGDAQFGVTFFTSSQRHDICGSNGLPLTPNSIRILGRSRYLKSLSHSNLAEYVEVIRGKHERIIVVSEFYPNNLLTLLKTHKIDPNDNLEALLKLIIQVLRALAYLNDQGIVSRNLTLDNILLDGTNTVKLFNYGLFHITNRGRYVSFPIGQPKYTAPELFLSNSQTGTPDLFSSDVWSLGIIVLEICLGRQLWQDLRLGQMIDKVVQLHKTDNVLNDILEEEKAIGILEGLDDRLVAVLTSSLTYDLSKRPSPKELLERLEQSLDEVGGPPRYLCSFSMDTCNCQLPEGSNSGRYYFQPQSFPLQVNSLHFRETESLSESNLLGQRSLKEVFYFWQLAGGDVIAELKRQGLTRKKPALLSLPRSMTLSGESVQSAKERGLLLDNTVIVLPLSELIKRLSRMPPSTYFPLIVSHIPGMNDDALDITRDAVSLPLIIRERDIEYQFNRVLLFDRLLRGYPHTKDLIYQECLLDIPPFFRARIWACLLGIEGDLSRGYEAIDKETPTSTDRQIEVDIPRCHQYDELLSSPAGHQKFKRILKAWVVSNNKDYVYWQGLDSLSAPFLYLNFNSEPLAYACLSSFIPKYLYNFFLKDNSAVIQEYLAKFSQLIAFHDPQLTNHLDSIGFIPELYAIPWFLTMFSHVFPLHKIFHLWDKLLLGDSSFSLCIGLSILYQLREGLLNSGFNECILLFSDMPEINIEKCVTDSVETYSNTPRSVLCRKHQPSESEGRSIILKNLGDRERSSGSYSFGGCELPGNSMLKMDPISLVELKKEKCPHISGEDLLVLLNLAQGPTLSPSVIMVDVRNREDYNRGAIPGSINIPYSTAFGTEGNLACTEDADFLNEHRGLVLTIVGNRGEAATKFAEKLLRLEYSKISVLHGGIDIFRSGNILLVPSVL